MLTGVNRLDAQVLLDSIQAYMHRHALKEPLLLVVHQDLFNNGNELCVRACPPVCRCSGGIDCPAE